MPTDVDSSAPKGDYKKKKSAASTLLKKNPTANVQDEERSNFNNRLSQNLKSVKRDFSLKEIFDKNGKSYGVGVVLDSTLLDNLTPEERVDMVKEYVKELAGNTFTAYDNDGKPVEIRVAKTNERFKNRKGKNVPVNKDLTSYLDDNETKQEAITLIDELIISAKKTNTEASKYSHGWLDNDGKNDWDYWTTYIQDKKNHLESSVKYC